MKRAAFLITRPSDRTIRALNYEPTLDRLRGSPKVERLGKLCPAQGAAYRTAFTRVDAEPEYGIELLAQSDVFTTYPAGRQIRPDCVRRPGDHTIKRFQILIAGVGTLGETELFGRPFIADKRLAGKYMSEDVFSLDFDSPESDVALYTYAWLASSAGLRLLRSACYGTKTLKLRRDLVESLPVPMVEPKVVASVANLVREAVLARETFADRLNEAKDVLDELPECGDAAEMCAKPRARCTTWNGNLPTLRAWNYASAGEAPRYLRSKWRARLRDVLLPPGAQKGGRFTRVAVEYPHGCDLLAQRDVFMMRPIPRRVARPHIYEELRVEGADVFIASRGQLVQGALFGSFELAANLPREAIVSEDFVRLRTTPGMAEVALAFFSTKLGRRLVQTTAYGTSIPGIRLDLLENLPFPTGPSSVLERVGELVRQSSEARRAALRSEAAAIRAIEEEVLPQWLG